MMYILYNYPHENSKPITSTSVITLPYCQRSTENYSLGRIKAVMWENEADQRKIHNATFSQTYMDERKQFHDTDSFGKDDLLLLAKLANEAHSFIYARRAELKNDD